MGVIQAETTLARPVAAGANGYATSIQPVLKDEPIEYVYSDVFYPDNNMDDYIKQEKDLSDYLYGGSQSKAEEPKKLRRFSILSNMYSVLFTDQAETEAEFIKKWKDSWQYGDILSDAAYDDIDKLWTIVEHKGEFSCVMPKAKPIEEYKPLELQRPMYELDSTDGTNNTITLEDFERAKKALVEADTSQQDFVYYGPNDIESEDDEEEDDIVVYNSVVGPKPEITRKEAVAKGYYFNDTCSCYDCNDIRSKYTIVD